jgi:SSS family solute:Na+ symporter
MHWVDMAIIVGYLVVMIGIGVYFLRRQQRVDEYFVGDRNIGPGHVGFSVVATDVGGGFSIGLGGLGFTMGLAGSWLLFSGLVGAWMAAVILIPRVKKLGDKFGFLTYPDYLEHRFDGRTRTLAALVSGIGYAGFVGAQILAGAKLCSAVFDITILTAVLIMAGVVIVYTAFGGLQAVIFTDSIQWFVLLSGLLFLALPFGYIAVGGWENLTAVLPASHFDIFNLSWTTFFTWMFTIVPIWFVGMTLYQRIYATRDQQAAKQAWFLAGLLEWPLMAFLGVTLGMFARVLFPESESEMGLPMLIRDVLPIGAVGLVSAAYFSAIMSTADSCLLASVGNFVNDLYQTYVNPKASEKRVLIVSRSLTVLIGVLAVGIALGIPKVLDSILLAYSFMVSGLFVPTLGGLLVKRVSAPAAFLSMLLGGGSAIAFNLFPSINPLTEAILASLPISFLALVVGTWLWPNRKQPLLA